MRGDAKVIEYLNKALKHELTAVNQYWLHYRILDNWGYKDLAKTWREESIEEMRHADALMARILFLEGAPNMQSLDTLRIGSDVKKVLECDLAAEVDARALYIEATQHCLSVKDAGSKLLFEQLTTTKSITSTFWKPSWNWSGKSASNSIARSTSASWKAEISPPAQARRDGRTSRRAGSSSGRLLGGGLGLAARKATLQGRPEAAHLHRGGAVRR